MNTICPGPIIVSAVKVRKGMLMWVDWNDGTDSGRVEGELCEEKSAYEKIC